MALSDLAVRQAKQPESPTPSATLMGYPWRSHLKATSSGTAATTGLESRNACRWALTPRSASGRRVPCATKPELFWPRASTPEYTVSRSGSPSASRTRARSRQCSISGSSIVGLSSRKDGRAGSHRSSASLQKTFFPPLGGGQSMRSVVVKYPSGQVI